jgi:hypothetical protein
MSTAPCVRLTVPPRAEYLVLSRLALSAVCRLTPLEADEVVDLKLAITEVASGVLGRDPREAGAPLLFVFTLEDERLVLEVRGALRAVMSADEQQLGRAIVEATVDEYSHADGATRLVKHLRDRGRPLPSPLEPGGP